MSIIELINLAHKTFIACSEEFRYMALLLASLVYIYCVGKNKTVRRMSYIGMGAIVLFFFPPLIKWGISCFSEYGYETLLLIPANILIAYTVVSVYNEAKERRQKGMWALFCCIMLLLSGKYAYSQIYAAGLLENNYYVNSEYMDVCSVIPLEEGNLILPCDTMIGQTLRRIDGRYQLLYGQDIETCAYSDTIQRIHDDLKSDLIPIEKVISLAEREGVTHVVLYKWSQYDTPLGNFVDSGRLRMWADADNYWVFIVSANK